MRNIRIRVPVIIRSNFQIIVRTIISRDGNIKEIHNHRNANRYRDGDKGHRLNQIETRIFVTRAKPSSTLKQP